MIFVYLKSIKCILIIVVLSFNGNVNDYLISFYFLVTALTGTIFFSNSGLEIPEKSYYKKEPVETTELNDENLTQYLNKILKTGHENIEKIRKDSNVFKL